jgi:hypothetical protein
MRVPTTIRIVLFVIVTAVIALSSVSFAEEVADKKDKSGTNPINFQDEIRFYNEYSWLNTAGDGTQNLTTAEFRSPFAGGKWAYRFRARYNALAADFNDDGIDDVNQSGVGDLDMRFLTIFSVKGMNAFAGAMEIFFNTANDTALGSGTTALGPQMFYVRFFKFGIGPYKGGLFAPGMQYKLSVHEDPGRVKTEQILVDLNFLMMAKSKKHWFFTNPQIVRDIESNLEFALIDIEFGRMLKRKGQSAYVRPTFTIGHDRPTDYGIEIGYKFVGFGG